MMELLERTKILIEESRLFASIISEGPEGPEDPAAMAFSMIHNKTMITQEMLQSYYRMWTSDRVYEVDEDRLSSEMTERVVYLSKMLFIEVLSAIEYSAKNVCSKRAPELEEPSHLRSIMRESFQLGIMTEARNREWNDIITIRNLAVHNNSVSDRSKRCQIGDVKISMRPNRMMKGPLYTFVELSRLAMGYYYEWLGSLIALDKEMSI